MRDIWAFRRAIHCKLDSEYSCSCCLKSVAPPYPKFHIPIFCHAAEACSISIPPNI